MQSEHTTRSRVMSALAAGCSAALLGLASACGGTDTTTGTTNGAQKDGGSTGGANGGSGGAASGSGAVMNGTGGTTDCPPECFVNNRCVNTCGDAPRDFGCCPCPPGMINVFSCPTPDAGNGAGGAPPGGTSCDPRKALCRSVPPTCVTGQVPSIDGSRWGPCVPIATCTCTSAADCPDSNQYTCHLSRGVCDYYVN